VDEDPVQKKKKRGVWGGIDREPQNEKKGGGGVNQIEGLDRNGERSNKAGFKTGGAKGGGPSPSKTQNKGGGG